MAERPLSEHPEEENKQNEETPPEEEESPYAPPHLVGRSDSQAQYANYFEAAFDPYAIHLLFGQISPPDIRTEDEDEEVRTFGLPARIVGHVVLTVDSAKFLISLLDDRIRQMEGSHDH